MTKWIGLLILFGFGTVLFQNCARVDLKRPEEVIDQVAKGKMNLCLDGAFANYTVETVSVTNVNIVNRGGVAQLDSDGDGLSDAEEASYGFDPLQRRTNGKFLDRICSDHSISHSCSDLHVTCSGISNGAGLSDCDIRALGLDLLFNHPVQGLDSDKDGMIDFLEIVHGTLPNQRDELDDPDHDLVRNAEEINTGGDPRSFDPSVDSLAKIDVRVSKVANSTCAGEEWSIDVQRLPWISNTKAVSDPLDATHSTGGLNFSRPERTNTAAVFVKLRSRLSPTAYSKVLLRQAILGENQDDISGSNTDFKEIGETEP